jgi:hypothetical protein
MKHARELSESHDKFGVSGPPRVEITGEWHCIAIAPDNIPPRARYRGLMP